MSSNVNLNFDIDELLKLQNDIDDAFLGIKENLEKSKNCFEELQTNVLGAQVNGLIIAIMGNMAGIKNKMDDSCRDLAAFLREQMSNYTNTYEGAVALLNNALAFIENNF